MGRLCSVFFATLTAFYVPFATSAEPPSVLRYTPQDISKITIKGQGFNVCFAPDYWATANCVDGSSIRYNNGRVDAYIMTRYYNYRDNIFHDIWCSGPTYENVISINSGTGKTTINAALDPSSPDCNAENYDGTLPLKVNLIGTYGNTGYVSEITSGINTSAGYRYKGKHYTWYESFSGLFGFVQGTSASDGTVTLDVNTELQNIK